MARETGDRSRSAPSWLTELLYAVDLVPTKITKANNREHDAYTVAD
jgi:hypothetical protein